MARRGRDILLVVAEDPILLRAVPPIVHAELPYLEPEIHTSARSATSRLQARAASIIITDVMMHLGGGFLVMAQAAQHSPETLILAATHPLHRRLAHQALERGAYDLVWTPVERLELLATLQCAIATYRLRQRLKSMQTRENRLRHLLRQSSVSATISFRPHGGRGQTAEWRATPSRELSPKRRQVLEKRMRLLQRRVTTHRAMLAMRLARAAERATARLSTR